MMSCVSHRLPPSICQRLSLSHLTSNTCFPYPTSSFERSAFGCLEITLQSISACVPLAAMHVCARACEVRAYLNISIHSWRWKRCRDWWVGGCGACSSQTAAPWEEIPPQHHSWQGSYAWMCSLWEGMLKYAVLLLAVEVWLWRVFRSCVVCHTPAFEGRACLFSQV